MSKKDKKIYVEVLYNQLKISIIFFVVLLIIFGVSRIIVKDELYAKENGVKVNAKVVDISEQNNPLHNPYKDDRTIYDITIKYTYKNKEYTYKTSTVPNKHIDINDVVDAYVLDNNPSEAIICTFTNSIFSLAIIPFLCLLFIVGIVNFISTIKQIKLYKNAFKNFLTITAEYVGVENRGFLSFQNYYIICRSDQINGVDMEFKSHSFNSGYLKNEIEENNIKQFEIKYNPDNPKQYIIDTNKIDKIMYN